MIGEYAIDYVEIAVLIIIILLILYILTSLLNEDYK